MARPKQQSEFPKDMQEFIDQGWTRNILFRIRAFNLRDSLNNPEDLMQDILLALMETDYIVRYSKDKGSFKTYLYGFVDNYLKKKFNKENTRHGKFIVSAASLISGGPESDAEFDGSEVYTELLDSGEDEARAVLTKVTIEEIREQLKGLPANSEYFNPEDNILYKRDPLTVFDLLMQDLSVKEVAQKLNVSKQFIYHLMKRIRQVEAFRNYIDSD